MKIAIGQDWKVETDEMQFVVSKRGVVQAGRFTKPENVGTEKWDVQGYCGTLGSCITLIGKKIVLQNNDINVIMDKLEEIKTLAEGIDRRLRVE